MMNIAIVEDNLPSAKALLAHIERFQLESNADLRCTIFRDGIDFIANYSSQWDLIFLDIEMPLLDGMSTARKVREMDGDVLIIFVTQLAQYAIEGYSVGALDYILKPINYYAFLPKMKRAMQIRECKGKEKYVMIKNKTSTHKISVETIRYIDVFTHTLYYHTAQGTFSSTGAVTLKSLAEELRPYGFIRCSQSHLVNLKFVKAINKESITVVNEGPLPVSRQLYKDFKQALMDYCEG